MNNYQLLAAWMEERAKNLKYGEIIVRIVRHDGQTRYVEKTVSEKDQPQGVSHG